MNNLEQSIVCVGPNIQIVGSNIWFRFHIEGKRLIVLEVDLRISDSIYHAASLVIAKVTQCTVLWQDIVGRKYHVFPDNNLIAPDLLFDPREIYIPDGYVPS